MAAAEAGAVDAAAARPPSRCLHESEVVLQRLWEKWPPEPTHASKRLLLEIAAAGGPAPELPLRFTRWSAAVLPAKIPAPTAAAAVMQPYDYPPPAAGEVLWHVNFADANLFGFWAGPLFAQDELMVSEHPCLAALRRMLKADGVECLTRAAHKATPCLVAGAERRVAVDATGIYGNAFARASAATLRQQCRPVEPPTVTNVIAIAALGHGKGFYSEQQLLDLLQSAYTGFAAAAYETERLCSGQRCVVHTGNWGCGAFGNSVTVISALQMVAARMAGVDLVYHLVTPQSQKGWDAGLRLVQQHAAAGTKTADFIRAVVHSKPKWGMSNGT